MIPGSNATAPMVRCLILAVAVLVALAVGFSGADPVYPCTYAGALRVAVTGAADAVWYSAAVPPPSLTGRVPGGTANLYPGASLGLMARVKNVGSSSGVPSLSIIDLVDRGGEWTGPERALEPSVDLGDLGTSIRVVISYTSSLRPARSYEVARGTLRELALSGRALRAPVSLAPYACSGRETGTWSVAMEVPRAADNRIQGDSASCTVRLGLTQSIR